MQDGSVPQPSVNLQWPALEIALAEDGRCRSKMSVEVVVQVPGFSGQTKNREKLLAVPFA